VLQLLQLLHIAGGGEGEGLLVVGDEEQLLLYDFHEGDVVLQELLVLDRSGG
jgi:hypothetical protein